MKAGDHNTKHYWIIKAILFCLFLCFSYPKTLLAQSPPPFTCTPFAFYTVSPSNTNAPSDLYGIDLLTSQVSLLAASFYPQPVNALGYNPADHHLWGFENATNILLRIGSDFTYTTDTIQGLTATGRAVGEIDDSGIMYAYSQNSTEIIRIDLNPASPNYLQLLSSITTSPMDITDWAMNPVDHNLYAVGLSGNLLRIVPSSGNVTDLGPVTGHMLDNINGSFRGAWMDSDGTLYMTSQYGFIYKIPYTHIGNTYSVYFELAPPSVTADGAACTQVPFTNPACSLLTYYSVTDVCATGFGSVTVAPVFANGSVVYSINGSPAQNSPYFGNLASGTYSILTIDSLGCTTFDSVTVTGNSVSFTSLVTNEPCFGDSVGTIILSASGGTGTYYFSIDNGVTFQSSPVFDQLPAGLYPAVVKDNFGCMQSATVTVTEPDQLMVNVNGDHAVCPGDTALIFAYPQGGSLPYQFLWSNGGTDYSLISIPVIDTLYLVTVTDVNGCTAQSDFSLTVLPQPLVAVSVPDTVCSGTPVLVPATANGGTGNYSYHWSTGDTGQQLVLVADSSTTCYLFITDANGCASAVVPVVINVYPSPEPKIVADPVHTSLFQPLVQFQDAGMGSIQWQWDFGDGTGSVVPNPVHLYNEDGTYPVVLYVSDDHGCTASDTLEIIIEDISTIYIPNAFTPNGDGINDYFMVAGTGFENTRMDIYDRWGRAVFLSTISNPRWNGCFEGKPGSACPVGVYVYSLDVRMNNGKKKAVTGKLSLIR